MSDVPVASNVKNENLFQSVNSHCMEMFTAKLTFSVFLKFIVTTNVGRYFLIALAALTLTSLLTAVLTVYGVMLIPIFGYIISTVLQFEFLCSSCFFDFRWNCNFPCL